MNLEFELDETIVNISHLILDSLLSIILYDIWRGVVYEFLFYFLLFFATVASQKWQVMQALNTVDYLDKPHLLAF